LLLGEMSLVGPRPVQSAYETDGFEQPDSSERLRRPGGITGLGSSLRGARELGEALDLDSWPMRWHWSLGPRLMLLLRPTAFALLQQRK